MSESQAETQEATEAEAPAGPKGIVLIGALVVSLLVGGAAGAFALGPMIAKKSGYVASAAKSDSAGAHGEEGGAGEGHGAEGEGAAPGESPLHLLDNLVLNPAGSGGSRFLMLAVAIEFKEAKYIEELKTRDSEARDVLLRVLGQHTVEQLADMANRDSFKRELADSLGTLFGKQKAIRRVYFPQFVIQ